jgi:hypothetical protein
MYDTQQLMMYPQFEAIFHLSTTAMPEWRMENVPYLKIKLSEIKKYC